LFSATKFVANLVSAIPITGEFVSRFFWWYKSGPELASAIIAIIVIWKAEYIAKFIEEIGCTGKSDKAK